MEKVLWVKYSFNVAPYEIVVIVLYYILCTYTYVNYFISKFRNQNSSYDLTAECFSLLNTEPTGIIWPIGSFHFQALLKSINHNVLTHGANIEKDTMKDFNFIYQNYPYPSGHFIDIIDHYCVSYIISDDAHIRHYKNTYMINPEDFDNNTEVFAESPTLKIFKVRRQYDQML